MAVTDYIYQQETVLKKDFEQWLINKMISAGWQQIGSNPPQSPTDTTPRFYLMKGRRATDNMDTFVGINGLGIRTRQSSGYSMQMNIVPFLDYTPGAAGTDGTTSQGTTPITLVKNSPGTATHQWTVAGIFNSTQYPADTQLNVRFCITPHNVSLMVRVPVFYAELGAHIFFGLPDLLSQEKNGGGTTVTGSNNGTSGNSAFYVADTPLNMPTGTGHVTHQSYSIAPPRSPDINGFFPLSVIYGGTTAHGMRLRHPSAYFLPDGGLLDGDVIQLNGMTFEVLNPQSKMSGSFLGGYLVYRIA